MLTGTWVRHLAWNSNEVRKDDGRNASGYQEAARLLQTSISWKTSDPCVTCGAAPGLPRLPDDRSRASSWRGSRYGCARPLVISGGVGQRASHVEHHVANAPKAAVLPHPKVPRGWKEYCHKMDCNRDTRRNRQTVKYFDNECVAPGPRLPSVKK